LLRSVISIFVPTIFQFSIKAAVPPGALHLEEVASMVVLGGAGTLIGGALGAGIEKHTPRRVADIGR
jgi:ABC-type branched-subunit amino acid transport system permease subunit